MFLGLQDPDPLVRGIDPDPDPDPALDLAIFVIDFQDASKKLFFNTLFCLLLFEATFISFFKDKKSKRVTK